MDKDLFDGLFKGAVAAFIGFTIAVIAAAGAIGYFFGSRL
jgi:hypothetical protein